MHCKVPQSAPCLRRAAQGGTAASLVLCAATVHVCSSVLTIPCPPRGWQIDNRETETAVHYCETIVWLGASPTEVRPAADRRVDARG